LTVADRLLNSLSLDFTLASTLALKITGPWPWKCWPWNHPYQADYITAVVANNLYKLNHIAGWYF